MEFTFKRVIRKLESVMLYEELKQRYGNHIAKRVQRELASNEFNKIGVEDLPHYLETRAEKVAQDYKKIMENPLERGNVRSEVLQRCWREAEDLAYLVSVAEEVATTVKSALMGSQ